jgi:hypothetical protein
VLKDFLLNFQIEKIYWTDNAYRHSYYIKATILIVLLLFQYSLCLGCLFLLEVITILVTFLFRERVSEALKEGIYESMEKYGKETESNQAIDFLQAQVGGGTEVQ